MNAVTEFISLSDLSAEDKAALETVNARQDFMLTRVKAWSSVNTGSWNAEGLNTLYPMIVTALSDDLDCKVEALPTKPIEEINNKGTKDSFQSGPVIRAQARLGAPMRVVMTGHYDTVFPAGTFTEITDLGDGKLNGPGLADMKGGITVMIDALRAFEAGPLKENIGYEIILTPDEETGNFASAPFLTAAAKEAHIGLTFEPAMDCDSLAGARKGSGIWDIVFHGRASHAGRAPEAGRSAISAAADLALRVEALNGQRDGVTFNVGSIDGGNAVNIVPDLAILRMGSRAPTPEAARWAEAAVKAELDAVLERDGITAHSHGGFYRPPKPRNAAQDKLISNVKETGKALGLELNFKDTGGVCEGNNVFAAGTPNIDTLGVRGGRIHSSEEFMVVDSLSERAGLAALLLNRIADGRIDAPAIKKLMGQ
jgi:glutamate carboxypeptidase